MKLFITFLALCFSVTLYAESCYTAKCHSEYKLDPKIHSPLKATDSCFLCHKVEAEDPKHPKLFPINNALVESTCKKCHETYLHEKISNQKFIHKTINEKGCLSCHDSHKSKFPKLVKKDPKFDLCLDCHKEIAESSQKSATHNFSKIEGGCMNCHASHASNNQKLLLKTPTELCMKCHKDGKHAVSFEGKTSVHKPVTEGKCTECHAVHGNNRENILVKNYNNGSFQSYSKEGTELCFECHKRELVETKNSMTATNFRDGDKNLHTIHVLNAKKGKGCAACHDSHGAENPFLIKSNFYYGDYSLPINFTKKENGGSCATACHQELPYSRSAP